MTTMMESGPAVSAPPTMRPAASGNNLQLVMATGAFAFCFAVFGSVSAMMPMLKKQLLLTPVQVSIALAIPVLLGSLGRIPLGMLTDRFGGRLMFSLVMLGSIIASYLMGTVNSYQQLLTFGFILGIALASFSVGAGFVSGWFPPTRQGAALGVYGAGNVGQSLAAFGAPMVAAALGFRWGFWLPGVLLTIWLVSYIALAQNAPNRAAPKPLSQVFEPLKDSRCWLLSTYYFLTFGGFVAMSVYLPTFLTELFQLTPQDAGRRTAGFVLLATAMRPLGGWLADRVGGSTILKYVFPATAVMACFLAVPRMIPFTIGALGMAAVIGLGNGAVFKLVPEYFPKSVGAVTGIVGAAGGLGGFFPPLVLGLVKQQLGAFTVGFILLGIFALFCLAMLYKTRPQPLLKAA
jgi:MFS transporter, NNP family, nitrate/nitrite transporter